MHGNETVNPQRVAAKPGILALGTFHGIYLDLVNPVGHARLSEQHAQGLHVDAVNPPIVVQTRADELLRPARPVETVAAAHEQPARHAVRRMIGHPLPGGHEPVGEPDQDMGSRGIGLDPVCVHFFLGRVLAVPDQFRPGPVDEVLRHTPLDRALLQHDPRIAHILAAHAVPEGHVVRIESAVHDDRLVLQHRPVNTIRRLERRQAGIVVRVPDSLVFLAGTAVGIRILERGKVVRPQALPHDVVPF